MRFAGHYALAALSPMLSSASIGGEGIGNMRRCLSVLAAGALLGCSLLLSACEEEPPEVVEVIRAIKTMTVAERASGQVRRFAGIVEATDTSSLSFEVSGNVRDVTVDIGDRVTAGQVLATLDPVPYELDVQAAESDLGRARAEFGEKELELQRQETLYNNGWVSKAAYDQAVAAYETAKNAVDYAVARLNLARRNLEKTTLYAPFDGVIASRSVDPFVEVPRGQPLFGIFTEDAMQVALSIPESAIDAINLGLPADVGLPTAQGCPCDAIVTEVGSAADEANAFPVKATLIDPPAAVRPGMTAEVTLLLGGSDEETAYLIPLSALAPGGDETRASVFVYDPDSATVKKTPIEIRGGHENRVAVYDGVSAGDIVAVAGVSFLTDGQKVRLLDQ